MRRDSNNPCAVFVRSVMTLVLLLALCVPNLDAAPVRLGVFDMDATPPVGSPLAYNIMDRFEASLRLKGVVLLGAGEPIALVAVDWIGIGGAGHLQFRETVADALGTTPRRVAVHCLHQHDAPRYDTSAESLLAAEGLAGRMYNVAWTRSVLEQLAAAAANAQQEARTITHFAYGQAAVERVASNRRILGEDGRVLYTRYTATADPKIRAFPEGTVDANLKTIAFYDNDELVTVLTYYATHPQSYYRTGTAHPDFPGMAREARQEQLNVPHIHFNGAGGNIGAGKYNDGAHENRAVLARRVSEGMAESLAAVGEKLELSAADIDWAVTEVHLPPAEHLDESSLLATLRDDEAAVPTRIAAAKAVAFLRRCRDGIPTEVSCLKIGDVRVLHMPGELFVEYQLQAAKLRPDLFVAVAAYGDYAPGYIGTEVSYSQGGYETSQPASRVAPRVEGVLMDAVEELLAEE